MFGLDGIDAPELKHPFSQQLKQALSAMVFEETINLQVTGTYRYNHTLAVVRVEGVNVNLEMVKRGMAWRYEKNSKDAALLAAQNEAKAAKHRMWADASPVPPWEWRSKVKKAK